MSQMQEKQAQTQEFYKKLKVDYEQLFSTEQGKRVLEDIQKSGLVGRIKYVPGDDSATLVNQGKEILAIHIAKMAQPEPELKKETAIK